MEVGDDGGGDGGVDERGRRKAGKKFAALEDKQTARGSSAWASGSPYRITTIVQSSEAKTIVAFGYSQG